MLDHNMAPHFATSLLYIIKSYVVEAGVERWTSFFSFLEVRMELD